MRALILAVTLAAAPALAATTPTANTSDIKSPLPGSVWRLNADGPEHLQSGLRCPPAVGDYHREGVTTFDNFGLDVSCGWNSQTSVITVYLFRVPDLAAAYANAKAELTGTNEGRRPALLGESRKVRGGLDGLAASSPSTTARGAATSGWPTSTAGRCSTARPISRRRRPTSRPSLAD